MRRTETQRCNGQRAAPQVHAAHPGGWGDRASSRHGCSRAVATLETREVKVPGFWAHSLPRRLRPPPRRPLKSRYGPLPSDHACSSEPSGRNESPIMVHNHIKRQVCADGAPEPRTCGVAVSRVSGSRWHARQTSRSGIFLQMTPGFFALPRGHMMSPTSPKGQTSTCSPPKVHTSTHYHHLLESKIQQRAWGRRCALRALSAVF